MPRLWQEVLVAHIKINGKVSGKAWKEYVRAKSSLKKGANRSQGWAGSQSDGWVHAWLSQTQIQVSILTTYMGMVLWMEQMCAHWNLVNGRKEKALEHLQGLGWQGRANVTPMVRVTTREAVAAPSLSPGRLVSIRPGPPSAPVSRETSFLLHSPLQIPQSDNSLSLENITLLCFLVTEQTYWCNERIPLDGKDHPKPDTHLCFIRKKNQGCSVHSSVGIAAQRPDTQVRNTYTAWRWVSHPSSRARG